VDLSRERYSGTQAEFAGDIREVDGNDPPVWDDQVREEAALVEDIPYEKDGACEAIVEGEWLGACEAITEGEEFGVGGGGIDVEEPPPPPPEVAVLAITPEPPPLVEEAAEGAAAAAAPPPLARLAACLAIFITPAAAPEKSPLMRK